MAYHWSWWLLSAIFLCGITHVEVAKKSKHDLIIKVEDIKGFKKLLRTRTNILCVFTKDEAAVRPSMDLYAEVADEVKGIGTMALVNCGAAKKMCKKLKVTPAPVEVKHYKDGAFSQNYDRKETVKVGKSILKSCYLTYD